MAKKGQYFQSYSNDLKYEVLVKHFNEYVNGVFDWIWFYKTERISLSERQHNINENIC